MKKCLLFVSVAALIFASCGSKPKTEEPVQEQIQEEVTQPVEQVTEQVEEKTEEIKEETPLIDNTAALSETEEARKAAIEAGADQVAADQFNAADALYKALEPEAKAGADVSAGLADVKARYDALTKYAQALELKNEIDENDYSSFDTASYEKGNNAIAGFTDILSGTTLSGTSMLEKADTAYKSYTAVLFKAYKSKAKDARTAAFKAKVNADSVKAGVAAKDEYKAAVEEFRAGDGSFAIQNPKAAMGHYEKAASQFTVVYEEVKAKREAAQKAMEEAKAVVEQSQNYAVDADTENPLTGEDVQGIEKEDAVLLEEETFEDPKAAEAEISADIDVADPETSEEETSENPVVEAVNNVIDNVKAADSDVKAASEEVKNSVNESYENVKNDAAALKNNVENAVLNLEAE